MLTRYKNTVPQISPRAVVMPGAHLIGDVRVGAKSSIWYGAVLRGDVAPICVGEYTSIQDNAVVHADQGNKVEIGDYVTIGHSAVLHGCTLEDGCLIGMSATVLDGAVVGKGSIVAAGCVVTKNTVIPPGSIVAGIPGKVLKQLDPAAYNDRIEHAKTYAELAEAHLASLKES